MVAKKRSCTYLYIFMVGRIARRAIDANVMGNFDCPFMRTTRNHAGVRFEDAVGIQLPRLGRRHGEHADRQS